MEGKHILFEGIDGSGKSTLLLAMSSALAAEGKKVFDVVALWKNEGRYPTVQEIAEADVLVTAEPSYVWVGAAIRGEFVRKGAGYSGWSAAMAFSLDREIHYRNIVLPGRERGKTILQDRGIGSAIAYQPIQAESFPLEDLLALPGNILALQHSPTALVVATLPPQLALDRLNARRDKQDNNVFEETARLQALHDRYHSDWFRSILTSRGTTIHAVSTETSQAESEAAAIALFRQIAA